MRDLCRQAGKEGCWLEGALHLRSRIVGPAVVEEMRQDSQCSSMAAAHCMRRKVGGLHMRVVVAAATWMLPGETHSLDEP